MIGIGMPISHRTMERIETLLATRSADTIGDRADGSTMPVLAAVRSSDPGGACSGVPPDRLRAMSVLACPPDRLRADIVKDVERTITGAFRRASRESGHNHRH